jgi:Fe-S cluster biogenesis protein NfuA
MRHRVERALAEQVLPALAMDGVSVEVVGIDAGVVQVRLGGACGGCPCSVQAVIMGVESELRRLVPEVDYLEGVP